MKICKNRNKIFLQIFLYTFVTSAIFLAFGIDGSNSQNQDLIKHLRNLNRERVEILTIQMLEIEELQRYSDEYVLRVERIKKEQHRITNELKALEEYLRLIEA